ncbi:hypothetical protein pdam_00001136 [Pocillopora damicornis]|uniref:NIDO domain-containing protein n=1 Tax=Pocillopora damicornis TaxID=46731 RepID=A0A3M6V346_POCDA|nr:hypothetical protein pdam_00001136 [Pocillopora damicornis]
MLPVNYHQFKSHHGHLVSQYIPVPFPLGDNCRLVAPFWADVNTRNGGEVFYRETTDPNQLQQATDDV